MSTRRILGWILVGGLVVAAVAASFALVEGSFDDSDWKVIGTSLGFSVYSALASAGASLRLRASEGKQRLGGLTMVLAGLGFVLLLAWVWPEPDENEAIVRAWGAISVAALAASHACMVTGARRPDDTEAVRLLATTSIVLGVVDATAAILPIVDILDDVGDGAELFGVLVIALLLTTALPPIMRKLGRSDGAPAAARAGTVNGPAERLAHDVLAVVDRIEEMNVGKAGRGPEIRRECERLRELARQYTA